MNRRRFIAASIGAAFTWSSATGAAKRNAHIGYLELVTQADGERLYRDFVEGLQSHGYVEGRTLRVPRRSAGALPERLRRPAAELAGSKVSVIVAKSWRLACG